MPKQILQQILNKWHDLKYLAYEPTKFDKEVIITNVVPNNCVLTNNNQIVLIERIEEGNVYFGKKYNTSEHFFTFPIGSKNMNIHKVKNVDMPL